MNQILWALDLGLSFSDSLAMYKLLEFTTCGKLDPKTHFFDIPPPKKEEKKSRRRRYVGIEFSLRVVHSDVLSADSVCNFLSIKFIYCVIFILYFHLFSLYILARDVMKLMCGIAQDCI